MSNNAIDILLKERERLIIERDAAILRFNGEIQELDAAIERISGKSVWETGRQVVYDDEHPDYIKGSIED